MAIQGLRDTNNFVTDQRPKNWREGIMLLYPNGSAPLTALTSLMKTRTVDDPEFYWWTKALQTRRMALTANIANKAAGVVDVLTVSAGALGVKAGDVLYIEESAERLLVNTDPTADTAVEVVRGAAGSTPAAVTYNGNGVNPNIVVIGSAYEEGSLAPTAVAFDPAKFYNFTQIFRSTIEMTRTAMKTKLRTGDQVKEAKREANEIMMVDVERALWFGRKYETTRNGKPLRFMDGVINQIPAGNKAAAGGAIDMKTLEGYFERIFAYGSNEKVAFAGNRALTAINQAVRKNSQYQIVGGTKEFGMAVTRLICPHGELAIKTHPLFNQMTGGHTGTTDYYGMNSSMVVLDAENLKYVYLDGDDIRYEQKLEVPGQDGMKSGYIGELSLELHHPDTHFMVTQLNTGIVDV